MAVRSYLNRLKFWKRTIDDGDPVSGFECNSEYKLSNKLQRFEKYIAQIQSVIMWDNPAISILCIVFTNLFFWAVASLEWRLYGMVSTFLLAMTVYEAWTGHVWPEISVKGSPAASDSNATPNTSVVAVSKLVTKACCQLKPISQWLRNLRQTHPGLFCCISSAVCSALLVLGRWVSGLLLVYCLVMAVLLGPRMFVSCVPPNLQQTLIQYATCVQKAFNNYGVTESSDEEYLPETTSEDLALLTRASDMHHDTYDSLTNPGSSSDIASGLEIMPSHEEDSLDNLSDFEPAPVSTKYLEFESGHWAGDSSSDEEPFTRDLVFSEADERDSAPAVSRALSSLIAQAVTSNMLGSVGMLANVLRPRPVQTSTPSTLDSRTDSDNDNDDFEFITRDELNSHDPSS